MVLDCRSSRPTGSGARSSWVGCRVVVATESVRRLTIEELFRDAGPPTDDDVPIALDGRLLDTPEKVIAHIDEINRNGVAVQHGG